MSNVSNLRVARIGEIGRTVVPYGYLVSVDVIRDFASQQSIIRGPGTGRPMLSNQVTWSHSMVLEMVMEGLTIEGE